ncbi:MAG: WG repeat-containing protein [Clostridia bacterium]|nr:WG repeat-containing protein [Clostridia bacterium]
MKKRLSAFLLAVVSAFCFLFASCNFDLGNNIGIQTPKTDEEKITATVNKFVDEYNDGDFEGVLECMEPKIRNTMRALFNLLGGIAGGKLGVDINLADLFSLGVGINDGDFINFDIQDIAIGEGKASVTAFMNLAPATAETMYIILVEEDGEWLIQDITDKKNSIENQSGIVSKDISGFYDGYAAVLYDKDEKQYLSIINQEGEILHSHEGKSGWSHIGEGAGWFTAYDIYTKTTEYEIVNPRGETVATSTELGFDKIIGGAYGYAWVYKLQSGIDGAKHLYNCIDSEGNYRGNWIDLQIPIIDNSGNLEIDIINKDTIKVTSFNETAILNIKTGKAFWLWYGSFLGVYEGNIIGIGGGYYDNAEDFKEWEEDKAIQFPLYYSIQSDGTIVEIPTHAFEKYRKKVSYSSGKLVYYCDGYDYDREEDINCVYIYDLATGEMGSYTDYPVYDSFGVVGDIEFYGDYGFVILYGKDYNYYFTVIDKTGKQQFEPIKCSYGGAYYSEGLIRYRDAAISSYWSVVDVKGHVLIPFSAGYEWIDDFYNGIAVAQTEDKKQLYIDKQGNVVLDSFYVAE